MCCMETRGGCCGVGGEVCKCVCRLVYTSVWIHVEDRGQSQVLILRCTHLLCFVATGFNRSGAHQQISAGWPVTFRGPSVSVSLAWHHKHKSQCLVSHKGFEVHTQAVVFAQQALFPAELSLRSLVQHLKVSSVCSQFFTSKYSFRTSHASSTPWPQFYKPSIMPCLGLPPLSPNCVLGTPGCHRQTKVCWDRPRF